MNTFWNENGTKVLGGITAGFGTLQTFITTGAFDKLLSEIAIGWLGIILGTATAVIGGATMARGFNVSAQVKVAQAMETAIRATPSEKGFVRPLMLALLLALSLPAMSLLQGCALSQTIPTSLDQRISAAYDQYTAALESIANNVNTHRMSGADGQHAIDLAAKAKYFLDAARGATDVQSAEGQLVLAASVLRELQAYLSERGAK